MNSLKILKVYLVISGLILTAIGALTTFNPIEIKANEGIQLAGNPSALNDVRSFGTLLLAVAIFSLLGAFKISLRKPASIFIPLLFTSIGIGRTISILLDGMPSEGIVKATIIEFVLGFLGIVLYFINKNKTLNI